MQNKAIILQAGGGYDKVTLGTRDAKDPKAGEITVRLHANSLNYHDFAVVSGMWGPTEPRIPMADGAGVVIAIGDGVTEFAVGDHVVSTFFPTWLAGEPLVEGFATTPGDGVDGYAREVVTAAVNAFTKAPKGRGSNAHNSRFNSMACINGRRCFKTRRYCIGARYRWRFNFCFAICKDGRCYCHCYFFKR